MDSQTSTVNNNQKTPKTLPIKYKSMLYASIHIIHKYLPAELWESIYEKLPLYSSVEEQMRYFDTHCDMKKIETELYKPMVKEHVKKEKLLNKPVKEKKPRPPRASSSSKKKNAAAEDPNITALETTFSSLSMEEKPVATTTEPEPPILIETTPIPPPSTVQETAVENTTATNVPEKAKGKETKRKTVAKKPTTKPDTEVVSNPIPTPITTTITTTTTTEKKPKAPRKKKEAAVVPQPQPAAEEEEEVRTTANEAAIEDTQDEPDMYLFIQNGERYWTTDEHFKNGYLYGSQKNEDGDTVPNSQLVGRLVDGVANLF
jgi:hypothetical protein